MIARVYIYLAEVQYIDVKSPVIRTDGSGIIEGKNIKTGKFCVIMDWSYAELIDDNATLIGKSRRKVQGDDA